MRHVSLKMALIGAAIVVLAKGAMAATITVHEPDGQGRVFVDVVGQINDEDFKTFKEKTDQIYPIGVGPNKQVIVTLISYGGHAKGGLLISDWIRKRGMSTFVPGDRTCTSACALIWLAGRPRNVGDNSLIGFHATFDPKTRQATGAGNAVIGGYLRDLGLGYDAIAFMTRAGPTSVEWLIPDRAKEFRVAWAMLQPARAIPIPAQPKLPPGVHLAAPPQVPWSKSAPQQALQQPAPAPPASPKPTTMPKELVGKWYNEDETHYDSIDVETQGYRWNRSFGCTLVSVNPGRTSDSWNFRFTCGAERRDQEQLWHLRDSDGRTRLVVRYPSDDRKGATKVYKRPEP